MGRLIYNEYSDQLIKDNNLDKYSKLLLDDAISISNNTEDNIFVAVDLYDNKSRDFSTMVISEVKNGRINILQCINKTYYYGRDSKIKSGIMEKFISNLKNKEIQL